MFIEKRLGREVLTLVSVKGTVLVSVKGVSIGERC